MKIFTGCDLVEQNRIAGLFTRYGDIFAKRILTPMEHAVFASLPSQRKSRFLALRFAAKEAILKALGTGLSQGISWQDINIQNDQWGKPVFTLLAKAQQRSAALKIQSQDLSLSDEKGYVLATCVLLGDDYV